MAKNGLAFELRNIIHKTKKRKANGYKRNVSVEINGSLVNLPLKETQ
jgi:hypothetical protein